MREKDIENTRLIHSLTNVFLDVYELDLETELIHIIRTEQDDMRLLKTEEIDFSTFKRFLLQNVPEEKKKKLVSNTVYFVHDQREEATDRDGYCDEY